MISRTTSFFLGFYLFFTTNIHAQEIEAVAQNSARKFQNLWFTAIPLFSLAIIYLYSTGKQEANARTWQLIIAGIICSGMFGLRYFFGR